MKKCIYILFSAVMCFSADIGYGQMDTCITNLKDASNNYDQGNFDDAIAVLKNTIAHCPLDKGDQIQAYSLLILCYVSVDNLEAADAAAEKVMKINPNYTPDKFKDDSKLINVFKKFSPEPMFSIGVAGGVNIPFEKTINQYSVVYPNGQAPASYKAKTGFQMGLQAERRVCNNLWVEIGGSYRSTGYQHILNDVEGEQINYSEKLTYFDVPLCLKYYFAFSRFQPYVQAGAYFSFLTTALSTTNNGVDKDIINRISLRNTYQTGAFGAVGASYMVKSFLLFCDIRYIIFPENVNKAGSRYNDEVNLFKYYYVDDDFRLNNIQFNAGVSFFLRYKNVRKK